MVQHARCHDRNMGNVCMTICSLNLPMVVGPNHTDYFTIESNERGDVVIMHHFLEIGLDLVAPDQIG